MYYEFMNNRTKIICTIGPSVTAYDKMIALIGAGMNVARLNFSHGTHEQHAKLIKNLRAAAKTADATLAIIQVGERPDSTSYIKAKKSFAKKIGAAEKHIQVLRRTSPVTPKDRESE